MLSMRVALSRMPWGFWGRDARAEEENGFGKMSWMAYAERLIRDDARLENLELRSEAGD